VILRLAIASLANLTNCNGKSLELSLLTTYPVTSHHTFSTPPGSSHLSTPTDIHREFEIQTRSDRPEGTSDQTRPDVSFRPTDRGRARPPKQYRVADPPMDPTDTPDLGSVLVLDRPVVILTTSITTSNQQVLLLHDTGIG